MKTFKPILYSPLSSTKPTIWVFNKETVDMELPEQLTHIIHLTAVKYTSKHELTTESRRLAIEFHGESKGSIMRVNKSFTLAILAVNSTRGYFSQLFYMSLISGSGKLMRPMNWIGSKDALEEGEGKVNVMVSSIEWSRCESYIVVLLNSRFFSILNEAGTALKLFDSSQRIDTYFAAIPKVKEASDNKTFVDCYKVFSIKR